MKSGSSWPLFGRDWQRRGAQAAFFPLEQRIELPDEVHEFAVVFFVLD
jgi:hypothetical protein